jgi:hypothetical protein
MTLTAQESRCIELACAHLGQVYGGTWRKTRELDQEHPSIASPEVEVSNGSATAAIEVKGLTVAELEGYHSWKPSLERYLAPPCPGHFFLMTCSYVTLPMGKPLKQHLRQEVARVAPTIPPQGSDVVLIPRDGYVVKLNDRLPGRIWCTGHNSHEDLEEVGARLDGWYYLIHDDNPWEHNFVTDAGRAAWHDRIVAGCQTPTIDGRFSWNEEWALYRTDDRDDEERHFEIGVVSAVFTGGSAVAAVWTMLEKGKAKFHQRWADHHVLVLDSSVPMIIGGRLASIAAEFDADDLGAVEMILLVDGETLTQVWPHAT